MRAPPRLLDPKTIAPAHMLGAVVALSSWSWLHRRWTVEDLQRLIVPPLQLGQFVALVRDDALVGWGSYALMNDLAAHGFASGTRKLEAADWRCGPHPWVLDVLAPHGDGAAVARALRSHLVARAEAENWPIRTCRWARRRQDGTIRRNGSLCHAS